MQRYVSRDAVSTHRVRQELQVVRFVDIRLQVMNVAGLNILQVGLIEHRHRRRLERLGDLLYPPWNHEGIDVGLAVRIDHHRAFKIRQAAFHFVDTESIGVDRILDLSEGESFSLQSIHAVIKVNDLHKQLVIRTLASVDLHLQLLKDQYLRIGIRFGICAVCVL
ncbi:hypothetical protein D3C76_903110 [compost metagenome]